MTPLHPQQCHHRRNIPLLHTLLYCFSLSSFFVLSLYAFVPSSIRRLPRDHVLHIKWRTGVIVGVMITGVGMYPWLFCQQHSMDSEDEAFGANTATTSPTWYRYLGFSWQPLQDMQIALHVLILYLGSLTCTWLRIYQYARILHQQNDLGNLQKNGKASRILPDSKTKLPIIPKLNYLRQSLNYTWMQPTIQSFKSFHDDEDHRWTKLRNLGIAPLAEEVIFRACLLPPLLASQIKSSHGTTLSPTQASWIAPLFFGVAHFHHFYEQYRQLPPRQRRSTKILCQLLLRVVVQWTYTTLFGAYVSHVFVRTGSLSGVVLAHVICNYMGLPDVSCAHPTSNLHGYRWFIMIVYFFGIGLFAVGFNSMLFPGESVLPLLLQQDV